MSTKSAKSAGRKVTNKPAEPETPTLSLRGRGRPKGSTDAAVQADRADFLAAVGKATDGGKVADISAAVEAVQSSRESRGKDRYTESSLRQILAGWARESGLVVQNQGGGLWVAGRRD